MRATLLACVLLLCPAIARGAVLWRGDFETGNLSQWGKIQRVAPDRIQVVQRPVRQGSYAGRFEVRKGDDPINASGNRAELVWLKAEVEGNDRYYSWYTGWSSSYPISYSWQLFTQWHHSGNSGSPPVELYVWGGEMLMRINKRVVWRAPFVRGRWRHFVLHVHWSSDPTRGFAELWLDGAKTLGKTYGATMFPGMVNYLKQGLYRDAAISTVGVLYHDGMTVATRPEDVMP